LEENITVFIIVVIAALVFEYIDASIGMGFGTTLTPILLIIGFLPLQVVPAVLLGQLAGGIVGGNTHSKVGNIKLDFKNDRDAVKRRLRGFGYLPKSADSKVIFILGICGVIGALAGVLIAINVPEILLNAYIGIMVLLIGIWIIVKRNKDIRFSWTKLGVVGLISAFNKGVSGGGYGPLVTGGQIISGKDSRSSVGNTTFIEPLICFIGFIGYLLLEGDIYWKLAISVTIGSILAAPFAALTVKKINHQKLKVVIGATTILLGIYTIINIFV